ncbi:MAG: hypothetical protein WC006_04860 [Bacilli bacterium]|nr:hypothetical protein [Bacilli bacterium]
MKFLNILATIKYEYLITGVTFAVLYIVWTIGIMPRIQKKEVKNVLETVAEKNGYKIKNETNKKYDFVLEGTSETKYSKILIKIAIVPRISTITINSKNTWNLHYGGSGKPGKGYPYNRYLNELIPHLNMEVNQEELKLVLIYKGTMKIQKYINESELEIVNYKNKVYDYKVISYEDLNSHFQDL